MHAVVPSPSELNFFKRVFESRIDLSGLNLNGVNFVCATLRGARFSADRDGHSRNSSSLQGTNFKGAKLDEAVFSTAYIGEANLNSSDLHLANLQNTDLNGADLRGANLLLADLKGANLYRTRLEGAYLFRCDLNTAVGLEFVDWGNYRIGEEIDAVYGHRGEYIHERFLRAEPIYRSLRYWHLRAGVADRAAEFYYREMECRRKQALSDYRWRDAVKLAFAHTFVGYGERPSRTFLWAAGIIVIFAAILFTLGGLTCGTEKSPSSCSGLDALYLSAVSFTALGYGDWAATPNEVGRFLGVFESFLGVFTMALFVTLFVRKMSR